MTHSPTTLHASSEFPAPSRVRPSAKAARSDVPALDRGLDLLEQLALANQPLSLAQIARNSGRTVSEVQRSVARLTRRAYLLRDARGLYRLSTKLFQLASSHPPFRDLIARSVPAMQGYADATGESAELSVLSADLLLLVAQVPGQGLLRLALRTGAAEDPIPCLAGRTLLALLNADEFAAFVARRGLSAAQAAPLRRACAAIRERGYGSAASERVQGVHQLGVPVALGAGHARVVLTSSILLAHEQRAEPLHLLGPLRAAARAIARAYEPERATPAER